MDKPPIKYTESRAIPVAIKRYVLWRDGTKCICGCGSSTKIQFDHCPEWNLLDPKRHDPDMIYCMAKACHDIKSGRNTTEAARVKRLKKVHEDGKAPSKNPIRSNSTLKSRGFDKSRTKKLNGKVVARCDNKQTRNK